MTAKSLHALLEGLVDYAGLFPPAALSMQDAVRNYARYRDSEHAWALGRFVVPAARLREVPPDFPVSILLGPANEEDTVVRSDATYEMKAASAAAIEAVPHGAAVFVEIADLSLLADVAARGLKAKIRTGGITEDAFPAIDDIAAFLRACRAKGVAFKATAGLHHPLRCVKPLTYEPNAPTGTMHGFLNVFLAAALLDHADGVLAERDPQAFSFDDDGAAWRGHRVSTSDIREMRRSFAVSFGSCSFEEPIADLRALGWLG